MSIPPNRLKEAVEAKGWHVGLLKMNLIAAGIAFLSDVTTQVLIEGKTLRFRRRRDSTKTTDDQEQEGQPVNFRRTVKFAGLNITILVPTTIWVGSMEAAYPNQPLLQSAMTWAFWNPVMFSVALLYRAVVTPETRSENIWKDIKDTFRSEFKYMPFIYCYAMPIVLLNFYVIPLDFVPLFMVVVDFFSDMFGSWWLHRRKQLEESQKQQQQQQHQKLPQDGSINESPVPSAPTTPRGDQFDAKTTNLKQKSA